MVKKRISKRSFGVIVAECVKSNPNGDPDANDMPRTMSDGHGFITPQCQKHRIRDLLSDHEDNVVWDYLVKELQLNEEDFFIWESPLKGFSVSTPSKAQVEWKKLFKEKGKDGFLKRFFDTRIFGCTSLEGKEDKKDALRFTRQGCISMSPMSSVLPIEIIVQTLVKANPLTQKGIDNAQGTPCPHALKIVRHGVYVGTYVINPAKAHYTKTTEKDIEVFKSLLPYHLSASTAALRSNVRTVQVFHADHDNVLGSFNESDFYEFCKPEVIDKKMVEQGIPSTSLDQYHLKTIEEIKERFPKVKVIGLVK